MDKVPDDYEELYQQMLQETAQPDFVAHGSLLTVWGKVPPLIRHRSTGRQCGYWNMRISNLIALLYWHQTYITSQEVPEHMISRFAWWQASPATRLFSLMPSAALSSETQP